MAMLETGILSPRIPAPRATRRLQVSFEFFPPKTEEMEESLWRAVTRLAPLRPRFMSVTYGAGGSTRERTHTTVRRILSETGVPPAAHLTCVGATCTEVDEVARAYWSAGIRHVVALRGDPPAGTAKFEPHPQGYESGAALVAGLRRVADFEISVAAYPEIHPDAKSSLADLDNLKRKIDSGATRAITQFFFDPDSYLRFLDRAVMHGVTVPIVPGIFPVTNFASATRMAKMCGATIPSWLAHLFEGLDADPETRRLIAATVAAEQCRRLLAAGIDEFHFYTLNRADLSYAICHLLGLRPAGVPA
jgi:methylenetetrahydrofolate reductase (NADPH)